MSSAVTISEEPKPPKIANKLVDRDPEPIGWRLPQGLNDTFEMVPYLASSVDLDENSQ